MKWLFETKTIQRFIDRFLRFNQNI